MMKVQDSELKSMQELIKTIGVDAAQALMENFGGTFITVGRRPTERSALYGLIPQAKLLLLGEYLAGVPLYIPQCSAVEKRARDDLIRAEYDSGANVRRLAVKYKLSARSIRTILNRA